MKILVTGGAGYIGSELVYKLSQDAAVTEIIVYDNLTRGNFNLFISSSNRIKNGKVKFIMGDILDTRKLKKALTGVEIVYHLAARVANPYESADSHIFEQTNNWGTAELVYAVEETTTVKKFIYLSSIGVYGFKNGAVADENERLNPRTFYSISKMRAEEHVSRLMTKMETVIFRCATVYGYSPAIRFDSVINRFLFDAHFTNRISIHGSGKQKRTFICLTSVINVLDFVKTNHIKSGIYNLAGRSMSVLEIVDVFKEMYPSLEFIFINQHVELKDLVVDQSPNLARYYLFGCKDFKPELMEIKERSFAF